MGQRMRTNTHAHGPVVNCWAADVMLSHRADWRGDNAEDLGIVEGGAWFASRAQTPTILTNVSVVSPSLFTQIPLLGHYRLPSDPSDSSLILAFDAVHSSYKQTRI
jgi:hypothetical protein